MNEQGAAGDAPVQQGLSLNMAELRESIPTTPHADVQKSGQQLSGLQSAGVGLAHRLILVIAIALVVLTALVTASEIWPSAEVGDLHRLVLQIHQKASQLPADSPSLPEVRKDLQELTRQIVDAKQAQRAFWIQFSQMILLNLLLPVLTAVLGYVFGANASAQREGRSGES